MNEPKLERVQDAIDALRVACASEMARIVRMVDRDDADGALREAIQIQLLCGQSVAAPGPHKPGKATSDDLAKVNELVLALDALVSEQRRSPTEPRPLISDATLAKIVRLTLAAEDGMLAANTGDNEAALRALIVLSAVCDGRLSDALDQARESACGAADPVPERALLAALEEANEEAARNADGERFFKAMTSLGPTP